MKNFKCKISVLTLALIFLVGLGSFAAVENPQITLVRGNIATALGHGNYESAYEMIVEYPDIFTKEKLATILTYYPDFAPYYEQLQAAGIAIAPAPADSNNTTAVTTPVSTPVPFTVETHKPAKTMWATQTVNTRSGASTEYGKVGSLTKHEAVQVTGVASTGWYQITKEDGTVVYVSNKYLSEEDPSDRVVYDYNEETEKVDTYTFTDTDPKVIDEKIEEIKATPEPTVAPTPAPTVEPTIAPTVEPTAAPTEEPITVFGIMNYSTWLIGTGIFAIVVIIISIVMMTKKRRR